MNISNLASVRIIIILIAKTLLPKSWHLFYEKKYKPERLKKRNLYKPFCRLYKNRESPPFCCYLVHRLFKAVIIALLIFKILKQKL